MEQCAEHTRQQQRVVLQLTNSKLAPPVQHIHLPRSNDCSLCVSRFTFTMQRCVALLLVTVSCALCVSALSLEGVTEQITSVAKDKVASALDEASTWEVASQSQDGLGCLSCKTKGLNIASCPLSMKVCGCIRSWHLKYKCTATEEHSRVSAEWGYSDSPTTAADKSVVELFNKLSSPGECNCASGSYTVGRCALPYRACFYFLNEQQIKDGQSSFKAFVDGGGSEGTSTAEASAQSAVASAIADLARINPAYMASCEGAEQLSSKMTFPEAEAFDLKIAAALQETA
jgi:hypothetical protein